MKNIIRLILVLTLVAAILPVGSAAAKRPPADPVCAQVATELGASYESIWLDGAITCVMYPALWNHDIVVFAHGYVDAREPIGIPWSQLNTTQPSLPELVLKLGYAFGTTSYSTNGLAVKQGVVDIVNLVERIRKTKKELNRVFLAGASEGGLVTELAIERYPQLFNGALSTCGPVGSFQKQVQYWGDFRVAFDQYFPLALASPYDPIYNIQPYGPSTPIYIDPFVVQNWETIRDTYVTGWLASDPGKVQALLTQTGVPIDIADPVTTAGESIMGLLYYNVEATNNGRTTFVPGATLNLTSFDGNPYSNPTYSSTYYPDGIIPDPAAISEIQAYYETTGKLKDQVVVMHTTGDPIIPFEQSQIFLRKAIAQGSLGNVMLIPVSRYGHCAFQPAEIVFGFYMMVLRSTIIPFSAAQIQAALPDEKSQALFKQLKENNK